MCKNINNKINNLNNKKINLYLIYITLFFLLQLLPKLNSILICSIYSSAIINSIIISAVVHDECAV